MMSNNIYQLFKNGFDKGHFIRIGDNREIGLYVGVDDKGRFSFDYRGLFRPTKIVGSEVIAVTQLKCDDEFFLRFSLEKPELLEPFCTFCSDLVDSISNITEGSIAYKVLYSKYFSWRQLFKPIHGLLNEKEIMGLIGELLFMEKHMIPKYGDSSAIESWMGPEKTHKDYSVGDIWYEIKAVNAGKETVHIASFEQLDSDNIGYLMVYGLEKMSPSFDGVNLNEQVLSVMRLLTGELQKEQFIEKLNAYGYSYNPEYDAYVYSIASESAYKVEGDFPRMCRSREPLSIASVQYDLFLNEISNYECDESQI